MFKKKLKNQKGFTLIEIIAVLVILGILAAVAVPKYVDMQDEARKKAAQGAVAEVKGRLSNGYAKYLLINNGAQPTPTSVIDAAGGATTVTNVGGDFTVAAVPGTDNVVITATMGGQTTVGTWKLPTTN